jgi:hypothetical protein
MQRYEFLANRVGKYGYTKGAELGVKSGKTTLHLLSMFPNLKMLAVDPWIRQDHPQAAPDGQTKSYGHDKHGKYESRFRARGKRYVDAGRLKIVKDFSHNHAANVKDGSLDFVFIDGDHTYEACKQDIIDWRPKVRIGGMIAGHDANWPGVTKAIQEEEQYYNIEPADNVWWTIKHETPTAHHNIVLEKDKVVFMLSARCGSRTFKSVIRSLLASGISPGKDPLGGLSFISKKTLISTDYSDYLKIAVVRNPYARLLSCYMDKVKRSLRPSIGYLGVKSGATFEEFCQVVHDTPDDIADGHFISQSSVLVAPDGEMIPDHIYKLESGITVGYKALKDIFKKQAGRALSPRLPHLNKASNQVSYKAHYTDEAKALVAERFAEDLERLGYAF